MADYSGDGKLGGLHPRHRRHGRPVKHNILYLPGRQAAGYRQNDDSNPHPGWGGSNVPAVPDLKKYQV